MEVNNTTIDIFKEISNIGAGNASTALAQLIDGKVLISVPNSKMVPFSETADLVGGPEAVVVAVLVEIHGDIDGVVMLVQELGNAVIMTRNIAGETYTPADFQDLNVLMKKLQPIEEIANILIGSYLSSISRMMGLTIIPSVPSMTVDMALAIMSVPASIYGEVGDEVLLLETQFLNDASKINGHFFMIPTIESHDKIVRILYG